MLLSTADVTPLVELPRPDWDCLEKERSGHKMRIKTKVKKGKN